MKTFRCPKCGTEIEQAIEDTDIIRLKPSAEQIERGVDPDHRYKAPGAKTRHVEPCGCRFAPDEFRDLVAMVQGAGA